MVHWRVLCSMPITEVSTPQRISRHSAQIWASFSLWVGWGQVPTTRSPNRSTPPQTRDPAKPQPVGRCRYLPPRSVPLARPLQPQTETLRCRYSSLASYENTHSLRCQQLLNPNPVSTIRGKGPSDTSPGASIHEYLRNRVAELLIGMNEVGGTGLTLQGLTQPSPRSKTHRARTNGSVTSLGSAPQLCGTLTISVYTAPKQPIPDHEAPQHHSYT